MTPEETLIEAARRYRGAHKVWKERNGAWKAEFPEEYEAWYGGVARGGPPVSLFSLPNWGRIVREANDAEMETWAALREAAKELP